MISELKPSQGDEGQRRNAKDPGPRSHGEERGKSRSLQLHFVYPLLKRYVLPDTGVSV
jgi:hypothetical protein